MVNKLGDIPVATPVTLVTHKESTFIAIYRGYNSVAARHMFGISLDGESETTVLFEDSAIASVTIRA